MDTAHVSFWLDILSGAIGIGYLLMGVFTYVWKDDRKRLKQVEDNKAEKTDMNGYHRDHKSDLKEIRDDIKEVRNLIISVIGKRE